MRTAKTLVLGLKGLELERLVVECHRATFFDGTRGIGAKCPVCGHPSSRIHTEPLHSGSSRPAVAENTRDASYSCPSFLPR